MSSVSSASESSSSEEEVDDAEYVYVNNDVRLTLETGADLTGASRKYIKYEKPSGAVGYWTATLAGTTKLRKSITHGQLNEAGIWKLRAWIKTGSLEYQGDPVELEVLDHWQVAD